MYEELLDRVYELEGLLQLALEREEIPARLHQLIADKALRIASPFSKITGREVIEAKASQEPEVEVTDEIEEEIPEEIVDELAGEVPDEEADEVTEEIDDEEIDEEVDEVSEEIPDEVAVEIVDTMRITVEPERMPLRKRFSLNDRFRFSRELFGGNANRFDETLHRLDDMATLSDAEDYLVDELGWDPDDDDIAAEFIDIIRSGFNS